MADVYDNALLASLEEKLDPARFPKMSAEMAAVLGCIFKKDYTEPRIVRIYITMDGIVIGQHLGDTNRGTLLGPAAKFDREWADTLRAANLTAEERRLADRLLASVSNDLRVAWAAEA